MSGYASLGVRYNIPGAVAMATDMGTSRLAIESAVTVYCRDHPEANLGDAAESVADSWLTMKR